jgi:1,4-dihydroxy-2-naphthoate octaprenyltransferase
MPKTEGMTVLAIGAAVVLIASSIGRFLAAIRLMSRYTVDEYLASKPARRLYTAVLVGPIVSVAAIVALAVSSRMWWVELASAAIFVGVVVKIALGLRMRLNGSYVEYYRRIQWR